MVHSNKKTYFSIDDISGIQDDEQNLLYTLEFLKPRISKHVKSLVEFQTTLLS